MDVLEIRRLAVRCHLPSASDAERRRLSRLFHGPIGMALESALADAGLDPREEICIRRLVVPSRLWLGMTDEALLAAWTAAAIDQLRQAIEGGSSDEVVRYHSRTDAVIDAVRSSVRGSTTRSWAWRKVGLTVHDQAESSARALLLEHPPAVVPAFRALAQDAAFRAVVSRLDDRAMAAIIDAALEHAGRNTTVGGVLERMSREPQPSADDRVRAQVLRALAAVRRSSAAALFQRGESLSRTAALILLGLLDAEPALLDRGPRSVAGIVAAIVWDLDRQNRGGASDDVRTKPRPKAEDEAAIRPELPDQPSVDDRLDSPATANHETASRRGSRSAATPAGGERDSKIRSSANEITDRAVRKSKTETKTDTANVERHEERDNDAAVDGRVRAFTEWAGLLFLVHIARDLDLAQRLLDEPALADRPLAWVLRQIAMAVVPATADDAAVRAFAGLPPLRETDAPEPLDPVRGSERAALLSWVRTLGAAACARLEQPVSDAVLYGLCARRGEIVADPGWIELRLSFDQISIDVRRAGLDLNPDYVDWLGVVMTVVYA